MIADYKFLLRANFNSKNRLSNIGIRYSPPPSLSHEDSLKECGDAYDKVHSLLEIKYGDSLGVKNGSPAMRYENFEMRAWVLSPTEIWIRKSIGRKYDWQAQCVVEINYGPRISESIDKL